MDTPRFDDRGPAPLAFEAAFEHSGPVAAAEARGTAGGSGVVGGDPAGGDELLPAYLSERDAPCPHCGYNLRGVRAAACPECGKAIRLGLIGPGRFAGYGLAIVLGLLWVFLASGMNAAREGRSVYLSAQAGANPLGGLFTFRGTSVTITRGPGVVTTWSSTTGSPAVVTTTPSPGRPGPQVWSQDLTVGITPTRPGGGTVAITPAVPGSAGGVAAGRGGVPAVMPQIAIPATTTVTMTPGAMAWGAVAPAEWARLGWWAGLGLMSLAGLLVMVVLWRRKRQPGRGAVRVMGVWAGLVFVAYSGYHLQNFVREAWAW